MNPENLALNVAMPVLGVSLVMAFARLVRGPNLVDRVVAVDLIGTLSIGIAGVYAVATHQAVFLDVAVILAMLLFLGTIAFAYFIERRTER
ncbi:MAG TPA: cation:proton antiporter [Phycisphaerae bacterium]|jgi:multicomponent Na+:H+ antiporter subunit F|nr:cation:proton antiporter [Phycisphaerae bacterium]HOB73044.1 cation:proton antiporter [Phycisphaerae bacterium]HOJ54075.1 cation:proton antiporter [Phycisphaerae bacterium]HOL26486.1 cation:proton antiporter [Phycisphaerae bacterium]HPP20465.1 cation:proton antiporter [Phycisphaerae bacterium]